MSRLHKYASGPIAMRNWLRQAAAAEEMQSRLLQKYKDEGCEIIGDTVVAPGVDICKMP